MKRISIFQYTPLLRVKGNWLKALVAVALAGFVIYAATAENPWDRHIAEKVRDGLKLTARDFKATGLWVAAVFNAAACVMLLLTARWWTGGKARPEAVRADTPQTRTIFGARGFWLLTLAAVLLGAWERQPALNHSLINDEELALRKFVWGQYDRQDDGTLKLERVDWDHTLYYTMTGNNHVAHTVCARLCLNAWQWWRNDPMETFSETALRMEPLLSGLASIAVIALLGRLLGFPLCGVCAAFLLALHPWHMFYSALARGYSGHLLFVLLALTFLALALRDGHRWRWWLGYGAAQTLYLLYYAGGIYMAAGLNAALLLGFLIERDHLALRRWFLACVVGAMVFLQIMAPALWKIAVWIRTTSGGKFPVPRGFIQEVWTNLTGIPASDELAVNAITHVLIPLLVGVGMVTLIWRSRFGRYAAGGYVFAAGLVALQLSTKPGEFYSWYLFFMLGGVVLFAAFSLMRLEQAAQKSGGRAAHIALVISAAVLISGFALMSAETRRVVREQPLHPMRDVVALVRGEAPAYDLRHEAVLTASIGAGNREMLSYDPRVHDCDRLADFDALIAKARQTGKPLVVYASGDQYRHGYRATKIPSLWARLNDPALFVHSDYVSSPNPFWGYSVFRLRPAAQP